MEDSVHLDVIAHKMNKMTTSETQVSSLLKSYIMERYKWEVDAYAEMERLSNIGEDKFTVFKVFRPKLEEIYERYLTDRERKYTLAFNKIGSDPYYNPNIESITEVLSKGKSKIIIRTIKKKSVGDRLNEYVFKKSKSEWKLDNKKTYWNFKKKWESALL